MTLQHQPIAPASPIKDGKGSDKSPSLNRQFQSSTLGLSAEEVLRRFEYMYRDFSRPF